MTLPTTPSAAFTTLHTDAQDGVLTITLDNPPLNAFSATTMRELRDLLTGLRSEATIKVIVLQSANPDLFIAHVDMNILEQADAFADVLASVPAGLNIFQFVSELLRNQPQVSIVKLAGTARGGGAEFVAAADFSFAATETADLGQIESLMGITPGGGATQYLLGKVSRNRALELVQTGERIDASTAAAYGWINRAVPATELDAFMDRTAHRIAALADGVVEAAKRALPPRDHAAGSSSSTRHGKASCRPVARQLMADALGVGAQTVEGEWDLEGLLRSVAVRRAQRRVTRGRARHECLACPVEHASTVLGITHDEIRRWMHASTTERPVTGASSPPRAGAAESQATAATRTQSGAVIDLAARRRGNEQLDDDDDNDGSTTAAHGTPRVD